jgi:Pyridoxamine 5'-phosphate oxidase
MVDAPRAPAVRKADTVAHLEAADADAWVATASPAGEVHLVPLSFAWDGEHLILAVEERSATARNLTSTGRARVALGGSRDVVMIEAVVADVVPVGTATGVADRYADQSDWDPRQAGDGYVFVLLSPRRVQAWREAHELAGRTLMRDGAWIV